jgi:geranylgeranyl pyrophosphate synthase
MTENINEYLKRRADEVNAKLDEVLKHKASEQYLTTLLGRSGYIYDMDAINKSVFEPAWYLLGLGGKRLRSVLMLTVIDALGKDSSQYLEFSLVPEVIHNATLIHDDIEDGSADRRGSPAVHVKFGIDIGNNIGDFMYFFPLVVLLDSPKLTPETKRRAMSICAREMLRCTVGQAIDIAWHNFLVDPFGITEENYMQMVFSKTGVLSSMAAQLGGVICGADDALTSALGRFGSTLGVAFQIQDDLLNIIPSGVSKNKGGVGDDITEGKITIYAIHAFRTLPENERSRLMEILRMHTQDQKLKDEAIALILKSGAVEHASGIQNRLVAEAWAGVDKLLPDSAGKEKLKQLLEFVVDRQI